MASATRKTIEKTVTEDVIVLELTKDEADWLRDALNVNYGNNGHYSEAIIKALDAPDGSLETDERPVQVGDKVRIIQAAYTNSYNGRTGEVTDIADHDSVGRYRVSFNDGGWEWTTTVERLDD